MGIDFITFTIFFFLIGSDNLIFGSLICIINDKSNLLVFCGFYLIELVKSVILEQEIWIRILSISKINWYLSLMVRAIIMCLLYSSHISIVIRKYEFNLSEFNRRKLKPN
jgi:hypothetical protein